MLNNLEKKINSGYLRKNKDGSFEIKYFKNKKQRQIYLLENDELTKSYKSSKYYSKYVNSKRMADIFVRGK